jgi:Fanconi-associated nuclease 1
MIMQVQIRGRPLNCEPGVRSRFYGYDGNQCGVEELALQYYASEDGGEWQGMHSEGGVWMTLFGLLMWEILFADVPDVFQTPFQVSFFSLSQVSYVAYGIKVLKYFLVEFHMMCYQTEDDAQY